MQLDLEVSEAPPALHPAAEWEQRARALVAGAGPKDGLLEVVLTSDAHLHALNREYRGKDQPTDVLSFSYLQDHEAERGPLLDGQLPARQFASDPVLPEGPVLVGQVLISLQRVRERSVRQQWSDEDELLLLVAHGLLHTLGYDHKADDEADAMARCERRLLEGFVAADQIRANHEGGGEVLG